MAQKAAELKKAKSEIRELRSGLKRTKAENRKLRVMLTRLIRTVMRLQQEADRICVVRDGIIVESHPADGC